MGLLDRTYGVEIECIGPVGLTHAQAADALSAAGIPCVSEGYNHRVPSTWKVTTDGSLGNYSRGMEIVSPPLSGETGFATITQVCNVLKQKGFNVSQQCGLHVHVGLRNPEFSIGAMRRLAMLYVENEPLIDSTMPPSRRGSANVYCRGMSNVSIAALSTAADINAICDLLYGRTPGTTQSYRSRRRRILSYDRRSQRFIKLNFTSYASYGTVEFRHHGGTIEPGKINMWVRAALRMVDKAANTPTAQVVTDVNRTLAIARRGTKRAIVVDLLKRAQGCTTAEVLAATGWRQVSVAGIAHQYGLTLRQQRERQNGSWTTRYFAVQTSEVERQASAPSLTQAVPVCTKASNLDEFADMLGMTDEERKYWKDRAALFANATNAVTTPTT